MFIAVFIGTIVVQFLLVELPGLNQTFMCTHMEVRDFERVCVCAREQAPCLCPRETALS